LDLPVSVGSAVNIKDGYLELEVGVPSQSNYRRAFEALERFPEWIL